MNNQMHSCCSV